MAVTQYIGSRYVPLFAEPIEWSSQNTYEPLTIVIYEGNSYTSKQAVPKDIDISNEAYWAVTGNYNAQVEMYRRETATAQETANAAQTSADAAQTDIDTLLPKTAFSSENTIKDYIDNAISDIEEINALLPKEEFSAENTVKQYIDDKYGLSNVRNYGAVENSDLINWQDIVNRISAVSDTINFDGGNWIINESISLPPNIVYVYGGGCSITSTQNVDTLFTLSRTDTKPHLFDGFYFELGGNVNIAIRVMSGNWGTISNCTFHHIKAYGIYSYNHIGLHVNNCIFENDYGESNGVAILGMSDNMIDHVKIFRMKYGIAITGGIITSSYFWLPCSGDIHRTYAVVTPRFFSYYETDLVINNDLSNINPLSMGAGRIILNGCELDCISVTSGCAETTITSCTFYWNFSDGQQDEYETDVAILEIAYTQGTNRNRNSGSLRMSDCNYHYGSANYTNRTREFTEVKINRDSLGAATTQDFNVTTKISNCGIDGTDATWGANVNKFAQNINNVTVDFTKTQRTIPNVYESLYNDSYIVIKMEPISEQRLMNYASSSSLGVYFRIENDDSVARSFKLFWHSYWLHFNVDTTTHELTYVEVPHITLYGGVTYATDAALEFKAYVYWDNMVINGKYYYNIYLILKPSRNMGFNVFESLKHPIHVCDSLLTQLPEENITDVTNKLSVYTSLDEGSQIYTRKTLP